MRTEAAACGDGKQAAHPQHAETATWLQEEEEETMMYFPSPHQKRVAFAGLCEIMQSGRRAQAWTLNSG
eukprot:540543-Pyramimonas_sp.AAC.1